MADPTVNIHEQMHSTYKVIVRLLPSGEEIDMELPASSTGLVIKETLLNHPELNIPKEDATGQRYTYQLVSKSSGQEITADKTLFECGVNDGDKLVLNPKLVAG